MRAKQGIAATRWPSFCSINYAASRTTFHQVTKKLLKYADHNYKLNLHNSTLDSFTCIVLKIKYLTVVCLV